MADHTKGPWHLADDGDIWAGLEDGPRVIARCEDYDEDAHLIAAAPSLLACLGRVEAALVGRTDHSDNLPTDLRELLADVRREIAAAKGGGHE